MTARRAASPKSCSPTRSALITALLGFATLWLACGTLARDVEECQIQMVAVKPIARWQIWLGKWFGIMALNAILLSRGGRLCLCAAPVARAAAAAEAQREILRNEVLVARGSARDASQPRLQPGSRSHFREPDQAQERQNKGPLSEADAELLRKQIREQVKASYEVVPPGHRREWNVKLGFASRWLHDQPLFLRIKFNAAQSSESGTFAGFVADRGLQFTDAPIRCEAMSLAPDTFHEFKVPPNLFDPDGTLTVNFINRNDTALLFPLEDGFEVLYREGGFGLNFIRGFASFSFGWPFWPPSDWPLRASFLSRWRHSFPSAC